MEWLERLLGIQPSDPETAPDTHAYQWQLWHTDPATPVMQQLDDFHKLLLIIMIAICVFVSALLAYVIFRFHHKRNPVPSKTTHNTLLEVAWTAIPVIILVVIAVPSFRALYYMETLPQDTEMTVKVVGRQWYWDYEYPDHGAFTFSSYIIPDDKLPPGGKRLLEVDNRMVVPANTTIRLIITGGDVIHAMAMPALGIKRDGIPGRLNESWMRIEREGVYYGQCSEICGTGHAYMPMVIEAVPREQFAAWVNQRRQAAGMEPLEPTKLAGGPKAPELTQTAERPAVPADPKTAAGE
ncbi:MAG TPA: cytochrome c oxidase subunit II [Azospirillaceae bacterium]|nr:cytochrome c oxidase subunit II [Azospirillaceae bacterium]